MPVINILSPHVADLIAAGEVVERPASVVKELMENSFDAGADSITVELRGGGATYIRVTDNGCGMAPEDAGVAFLRHATSKLKDEAGLEAIRTMGFRGEALAAIAAVSHIELRTRRRGDEFGTLVTLSGGDIQDMGPVGCPEGTTMIVRDLFYNTPARLKFLKSDRAEATACLQTALRCALGRPEISVRLLRDGKEEFFSPGDGRQDSCVYALLGRELAAPLLPCRAADGGLRVSGFVSSPAAGRGNRGVQYFFCNGRFIRSQLLQAAVEQAYKNTLLTGRFPACALWLELGYGSVDVNVHPAKTEVKFSHEKLLFDLVYGAVRLALEHEDRTAAPAAPASVPRPVDPPSGPSLDPGEDVSRGSFPGADPVPGPAPAPVSAGLPERPGAYRTASPGFSRGSGSHSAAFSGFSGRSDTFPAPRSGGTLRSPVQAPLYPDTPSSVPPEGARFDEAADFSPNRPDFPRNSVENPVQTVENVQAPAFTVLGEVQKTYLLVETAEGLLLIDKHAAHERMNFDRLKAQDRSVMSQTLLAPLPLRLSPGDEELLERHDALLQEFGFAIEPFGEDDYVLRAVPADIDCGDALAAVEEILEKLRTGRAPDAQSARDEILHTVACKAAIKAGWDTDREELQLLAAAVVSGQVKYCPHGRPVSVLLTRRELDKMFRRIV